MTINGVYVWVNEVICTMQLFVFICLLILGLYLNDNNSNKCDVVTLRNCNDMQKQKITAYENKNVDELKVILDMHDSEISILFHESHATIDILSNRITELQGEVQEMYDEMALLGLDYDNKMQEIQVEYQEEVLRDIIDYKIVGQESEEKKVAQNGEDSTSSGEV